MASRWVLGVIGVGFVSAAACGSDAQCEGVPACEPNEEEVDACLPGESCHEVELCGGTIHCRQSAQCEAAPVCDAGDTETSACPAGQVCYEVTKCGTTIVCTDADPHHGCPATAPSSASSCEDIATTLECHYPPCDFFTCTEGASGWAWQVSGGCA